MPPWLQFRRWGVASRGVIWMKGCCVIPVCLARVPMRSIRDHVVPLLINAGASISCIELAVEVLGMDADDAERAIVPHVIFPVRTRKETRTPFDRGVTYTRRRESQRVLAYYTDMPSKTRPGPRALRIEVRLGRRQMKVLGWRDPSILRRLTTSRAILRALERFLILADVDVLALGREITRHRAPSVRARLGSLWMKAEGLDDDELRRIGRGALRTIEATRCPDESDTGRWVEPTAHAVYTEFGQRAFEAGILRRLPFDVGALLHRGPAEM